MNLAETLPEKGIVFTILALAGASFYAVYCKLKSKKAPTPSQFLFVALMLCGLQTPCYAAYRILRGETQISEDWKAVVIVTFAGMFYTVAHKFGETLKAVRRPRGSARPRPAAEGPAQADAGDAPAPPQGSGAGDGRPPERGA